MWWRTFFVAAVNVSAVRYINCCVQKKNFERQICVMKKIFVYVYLFFIFCIMSFSFNSSQFISNLLVELIKKNQHKKLILWSKTKTLYLIFLKWWNEIFFERKNNVMKNTMKKKRRKMIWNSKSRINEHWNNYIEIIQILNEIFRLLCRRCELNIFYSNFSNIDCNSFCNYVNEWQCRLHKTNRYLSNQNVKIMF